MGTVLLITKENFVTDTVQLFLRKRKRGAERKSIADNVLELAGAYEANDDWYSAKKRKWSSA